MAKDPAFLFYSKDFYEGTRTLLPNERACLIDLMIYQHQNGQIPDDLERIMMYCSGINEATLKATLKAKFKLTPEGWVNIKLSEVVEERAKFGEKQSLNGKIGQFWKKAKAAIKASEYNKLRTWAYNNHTNQTLNEILIKNDNNYEAMLEAMLKHLEDANVIVNEDVNNNKGVETKKEIILPWNTPTFINAWENWKEYKKVEHKFNFKSKQSQQSALTQMAKNYQSEEDCIAAMSYTMSNGWKGLIAAPKNGFDIHNLSEAERKHLKLE